VRGGWRCVGSLWLLGLGISCQFSSCQLPVASLASLVAVTAWSRLHNWGMSPVEEVRALELSLLTDAVRKDPSKLALLLTEEFCEFGSSGRVYTKAEVIASLQEERERRIAMKDFVSQMIDSSTMLVRYRSVREGEDGVTVEALRSSIWVLRDGRWQILFHQGTLCQGTGVTT